MYTQLWCHIRDKRKAVNVTIYLLCARHLKIFFGWFPQMPYKVHSISVSKKLNNLLKITKLKISRMVFVFPNIFNLLCHTISQARENIILNIGRRKQWYGLDLFWRTNTELPGSIYLRSFSFFKVQLIFDFMPLKFFSVGFSWYVLSTFWEGRPVS